MFVSRSWCISHKTMHNSLYRMHRYHVGTVVVHYYAHLCLLSKSVPNIATHMLCSVSQEECAHNEAEMCESFYIFMFLQ